MRSSESSQSECEQYQSKQKKVNQRTPSKPYSLRTRGEKDPNFIIKSDDYFTMHGNKKVCTHLMFVLNCSIEYHLIRQFFYYIIDRNIEPHIGETEKPTTDGRKASQHT